MAPNATSKVIDPGSVSSLLPRLHPSLPASICLQGCADCFMLVALALAYRCTHGTRLARTTRPPSSPWYASPPWDHTSSTLRSIHAGVSLTFRVMLAKSLSMVDEFGSDGCSNLISADLIIGSDQASSLSHHSISRRSPLTRVLGGKYQYFTLILLHTSCHMLRSMKTAVPRSTRKGSRQLVVFFARQLRSKIARRPRLSSPPRLTRSLSP